MKKKMRGIGGDAHGAMFGVKGNIALASILFCVQHLVFISLSGREIPRAQEGYLQDDLIVVRKHEPCVPHYFCYALHSLFVQ